MKTSKHSSTSASRQSAAEGNGRGPGKGTSASSSRSTTSEGADKGDPQWREEWVKKGAISRLEDLQVRHRLDPGAIKRYRDRTAAGHEPPPIKVARVITAAGPVLYLVDGWHRWEAEALKEVADGYGDDPGPEVLALFADMTDREARWEAARANLDHGVPLKAGEYRNVLGAFIRAGRHRKGRGQVMSYRELAGAIGGPPHTTIRRWVMADFARLAQRMGGNEGGNEEAAPTAVEVEPMPDVHRREALEALQGIRAGAPAMDPAGRHAVLVELRRLEQALQALGAEQGTPEHDEF